MNVLMLLSKSLRHDQRVSKEAEALQEAGHTVTVLEWARHDETQPEEEQVGSVRVVRFFDTPLMKHLGSPVLTMPLWWRGGRELALRLHQRTAFDVVHAHDLDTLPIGAALKQRLGLPLVFDAHEIYARMLQGSRAFPVVSAARALERRLLPRADLVITVGDTFAEHYRAETDAPVFVVHNTFAAPPEQWTAPPEGPFTVTYIGILSRDRLFPELVDALGAVPDIRFVVGGKREGVWAQVEARAQAHGQVEFLGAVPYDQVLPRTRAGHAVVCALDPRNPQYQEAFATKLFDAMLCGRPLVVTAGTALACFVEAHDVGVVAPYEATAVAAAVARLRDDPEGCRRMGENGIRLARERYNWHEQSRALLEAYGTLEVGRSRTP